MRRDPAPRTIEQLLREVEKTERARGLLSLGSDKPGTGGGLLSGALNIGAVGPAPTPMAAALPQRASSSNITAMLNGAGAASPRRGLLSPPEEQGRKPGGLLSPGGLLAVAPAPAPARAARPETSQLGRVGNFLDDILFGGAAGDRRAERRTREEEQAAAAAHRDAFAYAMTPQGFDPTRYGARMGQLGQAPDMSGIVNLEGINDGRDVRDFRHRAERRNVVGGALAGVTRLPEDQRPHALAGVADYLAGEGYGIDPNMDSSRLNAAVGAAMGADGYLDNDRGERVFGETQRSNLAAEGYRNQDLAFRQDESGWERQYREGRANADDKYREAELDYRRDALTTPNSTGDVLAPILSKVATMGPDALTEGERAIWDRYVQSGQGGGWGGMGMPGAMPGVLPGVQPQAYAATPQGQQQDPFPGIAEGQIVDQDGKSYQRRGSQMIEVQPGHAD